MDVVLGQTELDQGLLLPKRERLRRLGVPTGQPVEQLLGRGRRDEDEEAVRLAFADEGRAVDVDLENDVVAPVQGVLDPPAGGPIVVVVDPRPLEEFLLFDQAEEFGLADEAIALAVHLPGSGRPGSVRHGVLELGGQLEEAPQNGILPHSAWSGDHNQEPGPGLTHLITAFYSANSTLIRSRRAGEPARSSTFPSAGVATSGLAHGAPAGESAPNGGRRPGHRGPGDGYRRGGPGSDGCAPFPTSPREGSGRPRSRSAGSRSPPPGRSQPPPSAAGSSGRGRCAPRFGPPGRPPRRPRSIGIDAR